MERLRIPKRSVEVELLLLGSGRQRVTVFLGEFSSEHAGSERLSDLLNGSADFLPAVEYGGGRLIFLGRSCIGAALVAGEEEPTDDATLPTEHEVRVVLIDGQELEGALSFVRPTDRSRIIDFLNDAPAFFPLLIAGQVALVNKRSVAHVVAS